MRLKTAIALVLVLLGGGALVHARSESAGQARPSANRTVDLPKGNPLTAPLRLSTAESAAFDSAKWKGSNLIAAALAAGGCEEPARIVAYLARYEQLCIALGDELGARPTPDKCVASIHRLLHRQVLKGGYRAEQNSLAATFDAGEFNCATATLLYVALASDCGLDAAAVELPGHVRAVVRCDRDRCEIEATCADEHQAIRWSYSPINSSAAGEHAFRAVSARGLVAMLYYNRGVDAFHAGRFADSIAANRRALRLDAANELARGNLLATVNNWSLALAANGHFVAAESLLAAGREFAPQHQPFMHNAAHIARQQALAKP